jgi:hypothetical protein
MLSPPYSAYKIDTYSHSLTIHPTIFTVVTITPIHYLHHYKGDSSRHDDTSINYYIFVEGREPPRSDFDTVIDDAELP